jgi:hypothetical protein
MANASIEKQVDITVKVLVTLLAEPKITASQLAKATEQSQSNIARLIGRFRDAGLHIDYDFSDECYKINLGERMQRTLLGRYAKQLARILSAAAKGHQEIRFVQSLDRYSLPEFAEAHGYTPQNVYNMIIGYRGQKLPAGWVAYQLQERGKWMVQRMDRDRSGKKYVLPENVESAFKYVIGSGDEPGTKADQESRTHCHIEKCRRRILSKGLCQTHYYMARRNKTKFKTLRLRAVGA